MNSRVIIIRGIIVVIVLILSLRLFSIQILDKSYKQAAQNNIIHKIIEYPYRGLIYDRNGKLLTHNIPVFDILVIPKEVELADSAEICDLDNINHR